MNIIQDKPANKDEYEFAQRCKQAKITYFFQPTPITILESFKGNIRKWRKVEYTPDFWLPDLNIYVEVKGFLRIGSSLRYRLADKYLVDNNIKYYMLKYRRDKGKKGFYNYAITNLKFSKFKDPSEHEFFNLI